MFCFEDGSMRKPDSRRTVATLVVAALYVALVVGAPLIVRYAPQTEVAAAAAQAAVYK
jgi:hypothetical protein